MSFAPDTSAIVGPAIDGERWSATIVQKARRDFPWQKKGPREVQLSEAGKVRRHGVKLSHPQHTRSFLFSPARTAGKYFPT